MLPLCITVLWSNVMSRRLAADLRETSPTPPQVPPLMSYTTLSLMTDARQLAALGRIVVPEHIECAAESAGSRCR